MACHCQVCCAWRVFDICMLTCEIWPQQSRGCITMLPRTNVLIYLSTTHTYLNDVLQRYNILLHPVRLSLKLHMHATTHAARRATR